MSIKIKVQMTTKLMYNFNIFHTYTHLSGIFGVIFGIVCMVLGMQAWGDGAMQNSLILIFFAIIFIIGNPIILWDKSRKQVKKTEMFQKPINYELNEEGIVISQDDQETSLPWEQIAKITSNSSSMIIYITRMRAFILPKKDFGNQYPDAVRLVSTRVSPEKVKIKTVS